MSLQTYDVGDEIRCTAVFTNATSGAALNPSQVFAEIRKPDRTVTTYEYGVDAELVRSSTGHFYVDVDVDIAGRWYYRFYSTGTGKAAHEGAFTVRESQFV